MYDLLLSADLMVANPDASADLLIRKLGILGHANWRQAFPTHAYVAHFLRVNRSLAVAPTRIEVQGHVAIDVPAADPFFPDYMESLIEFQGPNRPMKTHAIVLTASDMDATMTQLSRRRVPFRIAPRDSEMPFDRIWLGVTPEAPRYRPDYDGGLCIEIIGTPPLRLPAETFGPESPQPKDLPAGGMVRVVARGCLVRDLDAVLRVLSANLGWEPAGPVELYAEDGYRIARMGFDIGHSATLDLIEPQRWNSEAGYYLNTWGPGVYYIRISVDGLDSKAEDLRERGTGFVIVPPSSSHGRLLRVDPLDIGGALVEFVEAI